MTRNSIHLLNGAIFALIGIYFTFFLKAGSSTLGISFTKAQGITDFRATYGGMCLGIGLFFFIAYAQTSLYEAGLWLALTLYIGLGSVRLGGIFWDHSSTPLLWGLFFAEAILTFTCGWLLYH